MGFKCHVCNKEHENTDFLNVDYEDKEKNWICEECEEERYLNNYEINLNIHNSEETALIVEDYPYGFKRTKIRYWIETTKNGDRFISQTLNPKTNVWNKPKKSTYSDVMVLTTEKKTGYTKYRSWSVSYTDERDLKRFLSFIKEYSLNEGQKEKIKQGIAIYKVREGITFEVRAKKFKNLETGEISEQVSMFDLNKVVEVDDEGNEINKEEEKRKEQEQRNNINKAYAYEYSKIKETL